MRVLMLLPHPPFLLSSGGRVRSHNLLKALAKKRDLEIDLLCYVKDSELPYSRFFETVPCRSLRTIGRKERPSRENILRMTLMNKRCLFTQIHTVAEMCSAVVESLSINRYDLVYIVSFYMIDNIPDSIGVPIALEELSIEHAGMRRHVRFETDKLLKLIYLVDIIKQRHEEHRAWQRANACIVVSEADGKQITESVPTANLHIVPNGVDVEFFQSGDSECSVPTILFVGNYRYYPNVDAAILLARSIFPFVKQEIREARLILAGSDPPQIVKGLSELSGVSVTGFISDHRALLAEAWVFAAPLRSGGGTRIKILEAFSMRKAVVTTSIGAEGLYAENSSDLIIEDNPTKFAEWIVRLIKNKTLRDGLGNNARSLVIRRYRWEESSKYLLSAFSATVGNYRKM